MADDTDDTLLDDESLADELSPKRRRFVEEYIVDLNGTAAAIRAGYSAHTASEIAYELLRIPEVEAAIQRAKARRARVAGINANYVLDVISETIERCRQAEPVYGRDGRPLLVPSPRGDGELVPAFTFDSRGALKGAELLGKHLGILIERKAVTFPEGVPVVQLSKDDFRELAGDLVGKV
jgi:phage terminase small subunit